MACTNRSGGFEDMLLRYAEQGIDPINRGKLMGHLKECAGCRAKLDDIRHFLNLIGSIDPSALGDKTPCPAAEELVALSESPKTISPARIDEIKKHLIECFHCNEHLRRLVALNKQLGRSDFIQQNPMPAALRKKLFRLVRERVMSGAASGEPVAIRLDGGPGMIPADACLAGTGRAAQPGQREIPAVREEISGAVADSSGKPVREEWISLVRNGVPVCRMRTNRIGGFRFKNLVQGFYEIRVRSNSVTVILKKGHAHANGR
jgi:hypothetical protein